MGEVEKKKDAKDELTKSRKQVMGLLSELKIDYFDKGFGICFVLV